MGIPKKKQTLLYFTYESFEELMEIIHIFPISPMYSVHRQPKNSFVQVQLHCTKCGLKALPFSILCMQNIFRINYSWAVLM